jgi:hypothetical protein
MAMDDWLIQHQRRDRPALRAIALVRFGLDVGEHVDLGLNLIPLDNTNQDYPVQVLERIKTVSGRKAVEKDYNDTFHDVGHWKRQTKPGSLQGHLRKIDDNFSHAHYRRALALLDHDLTPAERLYFELPGWISASPDKAIRVLEGLVSGQVPLSRLEADWKTFVIGKGYTDLALRAYLRSVLIGKPGSSEALLLAQLDTLPEAEPAALSPTRDPW